jgi:hypothetical protein
MAEVNQQALSSFRECLYFQLDHQAPLYSMLVKVVPNTMLVFADKECDVALKTRSSLTISH